MAVIFTVSGAVTTGDPFEGFATNDSAVDCESPSTTVSGADRLVVRGYCVANDNNKGTGGDNYPNGGLVYVYAGPGAGEVGVVADYDDAGGTPDEKLILHRAFNATLTSDSKIIIVAGEGAGDRGISIFNRIDSGDEDNLIANDGADNGDWCVYADWRELESYLRQLTLPVVPALSIYAS
jgi:hypothetical protein